MCACFFACIRMDISKNVFVKMPNKNVSVCGMTAEKYTHLDVDDRMCKINDFAMPTDKNTSPFVRGRPAYLCIIIQKIES